MKPEIEAVAAVLRTHHSFILTTHVNPDGDGLGSEVALAEWLRSQGKSAAIINCSPTPAVYDFLNESGSIRTFDDRTDVVMIRQADVVIVLDTNHPDRLRAMEAHVLASPAIRICIDHHLDPAPFAQHYLIDDEATSTGEIVYKLLVHISGERLSPAMASGLYCAIMTDTGSFRYPRVDPEIHAIVANLIHCGADPVAIYQNVYERFTKGRIQLLGMTLASLTTAHEGRLAYVTVTQQMLTQTATSEEDTDNFTTYPMSVQGVIAGILFLELRNGVKMSFRSKGDVPINELAKEFGGNGHKNAAGARLHNTPLDDLRGRVIAAAEKYVTPDGFAA